MNVGLLIEAAVALYLLLTPAQPWYGLVNAHLGAGLPGAVSLSEAERSKGCLRLFPDTFLADADGVWISQENLVTLKRSLPLPDLNGTHPVLMFKEVWGRSFCRTIEKLVEVVHEYPTEVEYIYSPACVPLVRCSGCCGDENLECHPTEAANVTMQLLKIRPSEPVQEYVEMTFMEHRTCECRPRKPVVKERKRQRGRGRKRKEKQKKKDCER